MADVHEIIKWKVITDWTKNNRGRLYCMNQALAYPIRYDAGGEIKPSDSPKWFGPLKRKFKGFPDTFGFEYFTEIKHVKNSCVGEPVTFPLFCVVEVKTKGDRVKPAQRRVLSFLRSIGARVYIAWEADNERGYILKEWEKCQ